MVDEMSVAAADEAVVTEDMIAALKGRAAFYDLLAAIYFRPLTAEQIDNIAEMDWSEYADVNELFADGVNDITRYLRKRNSGTRQALAVDFTSAFAGTSSWKGRDAVPYESVHTSEEGLMFQDAYHEVFQLYKANHVAKAEGYDFPHDHLSCSRIASLPLLRLATTRRPCARCASPARFSPTISSRGSTRSRIWRFCFWRRASIGVS